jgi:hypothetical protein
MMRRAAAQSQLDAAVEQSSVTLVLGLPRVGRTSLLNDWHDRHADVRLCHTPAEFQYDPGVLILDHADHRVVDEIIAFVRAAEVAKSRTRLVIAPSI